MREAHEFKESLLVIMIEYIAKSGIVRRKLDNRR